MSHRERLLVFVLQTVVLLIAFFAALLIYAYTVGDWVDFQAHIMLPFFGIPLVVYLIISSAIGAGIMLAMLELISRKRRQRYLQQLSEIGQGNYLSATLQEELSHADDSVMRRLAEVNRKFISLQQELQVYSNQPIRFEGETKEEILEHERHRVARELHDSVSQQLFAAMMMLSAVSQTMQQQQQAPKLVDLVLKVERVINEAQSEMRALLLHLRPVSLSGKSLKEGILQLLNELQTKIAIKINWQLDDLTMSAGVEDNLFRIVQELLSNTLRHAQAKQIQVVLKRLDQVIVLRVIDDGIGFDMEQNENAGSYGLSNIRERAETIGGTVKIISFKNQGTSVEIKVPLIEEEDHDQSHDSGRS